MEKILNDMIVTILSYNSDLMMLALSKRAKFEGWLKFELANILSRTYSDTEVERSTVSDGSIVHVDIYSNKSWIELKTSNTSYKADGCSDLTRPVTANVHSILHDIDKLRRIKDPDERYIAFVMFPIDQAEGKYTNHIQNVKNKLKKPASIVERIIQIKKIPVLVFTAKVV